MAGSTEKPSKTISKLLRTKANEFLTSRKHSNNIVDIVNYFESDTNRSACLLAFELIFTELLKRREMYQEIVPLKPVDHNNPECQYRMWLQEVYEDCFQKILLCMENEKASLQKNEKEKASLQLQAFSTAMKLMSWEGKYPLEPKHNEYSFPRFKLELIIIKLLSSEQNNSQLLHKFKEYTVYPDVVFFTWKLLPRLTPKTHPNEIFIMNFLHLLDTLVLPSPQDPGYNPDILYCYTEENNCFKFDVKSVRRSLNKVWGCVMHWDHTPLTLLKLLKVLLERILSHLDKPLLLTDFFMDSLDMGGQIGILALDGIFRLMQVHNLDYPDIFTKLYSMFEPEIFHMKYKARLFLLADIFLSSTHLPITLVAAFAKRLARLALIAPPEDIISICYFIGNLMIRHPGLIFLVNHNESYVKTIDSMEGKNPDPYIMEERDPMKSNATMSQLWEIKSLQRHVLPSVAIACRFINRPLPSTEWDLSKALETKTWDLFDREIKIHQKEIAMNFESPREPTVVFSELINVGPFGKTKELYEKHKVKY